MPQVEISHGTIDYVENGSGPPVVLLHGLFMNHTVWDQVIGLLPSGWRYIRPDLPLGAHRTPMNADADLSLRGLGQLVAEFLAALDLRDVVMVHSDWGGALFMTAYGLDDRIARQIICPSEAFENFPPGLPGAMVKFAARMPGGLTLALRQLRISWLRRTPPMLGQMAKRPVPDDLVRGWTEPGLRDPRVRRDVRVHATGRFDDAELIADTEALRKFNGDVLVLWSDNRVMPLAHGQRLAELIPHARLRVIDDAKVLVMLDQPAQVAAAMTEFLREAGPTAG
ncbi:alpha/beta fold hydrolase [Phytoactinopolyspora mesophila]|uniref:Alpha/beta fold hydrolase n=1 Tax=Phytoactinopolyspora mesophila TaxID=2650750 RepID=A0A7K3M8A7_9ACTN|nr:alpha/beta hydrolase [Phytoactinopolyspora mesophila]NDL59504.1 alpha/beta fold hydrolase [Phytoactinopolyspora mesophila]